MRRDTSSSSPLRSHRATILAAYLGLSCLALHATVVDTDADSQLPATMDGGGSSGDSAQYVANGGGTVNFNPSSTVVFVGDQNDYNQLWIENGTTVTTTHHVYVGSNSGSTNNNITVTGSGSLLNVINSYLSIGLGGTNNTMSLLNGGQAASQIGNIGLYNSAIDNSVLLNGSNSRWWIGGTLNLGASGNTGNLLTITSDAIVSTGTLNINGTGNLLRLNGGFLAWSGDVTGNSSGYIPDLISGGTIQYWDGSGYVAGNVSNFVFQYFPNTTTGDADALAFSGYGNLGGYTILTTAAVPEPSTYALLTGLCAACCLAFRRLRRLPAEN